MAVTLLQAKAGEDKLIPVRQLVDSDARDRDLLLPLVAEVVTEAGSVLVFCASRKQCQSCAELLVDLLPGHIPPVAEVHSHRYSMTLHSQGHASQVSILRCLLPSKHHQSLER